MNTTIDTKLCPDCRANIVHEYRETRFIFRDNAELVEERVHAWTVKCANGHIHNVVSRLSFDPYWRLKRE